MRHAPDRTQHVEQLLRQISIQYRMPVQSLDGDLRLINRTSINRTWRRCTARRAEADRLRKVLLPGSTKLYLVRLERERYLQEYGTERE